VTAEAALMELLDRFSQYLWPFLRIGAFVMVMPLVGSSFVPATARLLFGIALTAVVVPVLPDYAAPEILSLAGLILIAQEILVGIAMGFAVQLLFDAITLGGQAIAMSMGLGFAVFVDSARGINVPVLGQFFLILGVLIFLTLDGHLALIGLLAQSFEWLPISAGGLGLPGISVLLEWSAQVFVLALKIALPALVALIIVNLSFGVMSRAAPTLNLFAVGFPVAMLLGFVIIYLNIASLEQNIAAFLAAALAMLPELVGG
jgi:flagellar biosynthetic protein FliR